LGAALSGGPFLERVRARETLLERYSSLPPGCPKIASNKIMDLCGVYYPDRIG